MSGKNKSTGQAMALSLKELLKQLTIKAITTNPDKLREECGSLSEQDKTAAIKAVKLLHDSFYASQQEVVGEITSPVENLKKSAGELDKRLQILCREFETIEKAQWFKELLQTDNSVKDLTEKNRNLGKEKLILQTERDKLKDDNEATHVQNESLLEEKTSLFAQKERLERDLKKYKATLGEQTKAFVGVLAEPLEELERAYADMLRMAATPEDCASFLSGAMQGLFEKLASLGIMPIVDWETFEGKTAIPYIPDEHNLIGGGTVEVGSNVCAQTLGLRVEKNERLGTSEEYFARPVKVEPLRGEDNKEARTPENTDDNL